MWGVQVRPAQVTVDEREDRGASDRESFWGGLDTSCMPSLTD